MNKRVCCVCRKGIDDVGVLYRVNAKGKPGVWACGKHVKQTDAEPISAEVRAIVNAFSGNNND